MSDMASENPQLTQLEQLSNRIDKYDSAIGRVSDLHDHTLGTEEGPMQYDLSLIDPQQFPEYHREASEQVRGVKLQLANKTFEKLLEQRDALSDLYTRATDAEERFRKAEEEYLTSQGDSEDDTKFEDAYRLLQLTRDEIAAVFQGRDNKKDEKRGEGEEKPTEDENIVGAPNEETEQAQEPEHQEEQRVSIDVPGGKKDVGQEVAVRQEGRSLSILPAQIALEEDDVRHLEWVAKVDLSRVPVARQLDELAMKVAEIRTGQRPLPVLGDFIEANTKLDNPKRRTLVAAALEGLIATQILLPDGSINPRRGLPMMLAKDVNRLIAMTSPLIVADAIGEMPSVEKGLLCSSLSVAMKEKVGIPDLEFCDADDAASYLTNAMYDVLKPARERRIRAQQRRVRDERDIESADVTWQEHYHGRDTTLPVEVDELLSVIIERDQRDGGFAQHVIDSMFRQNRQNGKSQSAENQAGILDNLLEELIDYCEDMDMLGDLQEFFASHQATSKYYRMISRRVDLDRGQKLVEYV